MTVRLIQGDCLVEMARLEAGSVDMILADLPYGTTSCAWDSIIPLDQLWVAYRRLLRTGGVVVLTAAQPFTTQVIASNLRDFKYCWYWDKKAVTGFANAKLQPLRCVEDVIVFYSSRPTYNPQGLVRFDRTVNKGKSAGGETVQGDAIGNGKGSLRSGSDYVQEWTNYPKQLLEIPRDRSKVHPTQKPVALMEYLIRTYTNPGDTVLDNTMGSGTTIVAAVNTGRNAIGIERDPDYFRIVSERVRAAQPRLVVDLDQFRRVAEWNRRVQSFRGVAA